MNHDIVAWADGCPRKRIVARSWNEAARIYRERVESEGYPRPNAVKLAQPWWSEEEETDEEK